jgi:hypothetical protein
MKIRGFASSLYDTSSDKKERIGTKRVTQDGRVFRYAKAGASALSAGYMGLSTQPNSGWVHQACPTTAVGTRIITLTVTAGGTLAAGDLESSYMMISGPKAGAATGMIYEIDFNTALAAGGTSLTVTLADPVKVALTTSMYFTILVSPWYKVVESGTEENVPSGIPLVAVTAAYYYWCQTKGPAACHIQTGHSLNPGASLYLHASPGHLTGLESTPDLDLPLVARLAGTQRLAANTKYAWPIILEVEAG